MEEQKEESHVSDPIIPIHKTSSERLKTVRANLSGRKEHKQMNMPFISSVKSKTFQLPPHKKYY